MSVFVLPCKKVGPVISHSTRNNSLLMYDSFDSIWDNFPLGTCCLQQHHHLFIMLDGRFSLLFCTASNGIIIQELYNFTYTLRTVISSYDLSDAALRRRNAIGSLSVYLPSHRVTTQISLSPEIHSHPQRR